MVKYGNNEEYSVVGQEPYDPQHKILPEIKFRFPGRKAVSAVIIGSISVPGIALAALFTIVATWNDCFLPLIMLKDSDWFPLTIGLNQWKDQASTAGGQAIQNLVITGSLITIIPLVIAFLCLQKYWQSGLAAGAVKE
mgnify:CR=1 FL=1